MQTLPAPSAKRLGHSCEHLWHIYPSSQYREWKRRTNQPAQETSVRHHHLSIAMISRDDAKYRRYEKPLKEDEASFEHPVSHATPV